MKKYRLMVLLSIFMLAAVAACRGGGTPTPAVFPTETAVSAAIPPTETVTNEPPTAVPVTPTSESTATDPEPTSEALFPTPVVTPTPTQTSTEAAPNYTITILEPDSSAPLLAGREVTFRGEIEPATTEPLLLAVKIGSFTAVSAEIIADANSGRWEQSITLPEAVSGPGVLSVALGELARAEQPLPLAFDSSSEAPYISLSRPMEGETAVGGYAFFLQGDSNNLIDDAFTIGILVDDCTNFIAAQKISLSSGPWYGFVILPQNAQPGPACAVAYTGEYGQEGWREAMVPIQLKAYDDPQATLLHLGTPGELSFTVGEESTLFGVVVNMPDGAVTIELVLDSATAGSQPVATGRAFADQFGLWSIDLALPADAPSGLGLLTISAGEGDSYREIRQPVTISP